MDATTIKIHHNTKHKLNTFREYKNESYNEVIEKLVYIAENLASAPELSQETIKAIQAARKRMTSGKSISHEDMKKRLGLE